MKNILSTKKALPVIAIIFAALTLSSCLDDDDDNDLGTLRADFAMIQTNSAGMTVGFLTDDDVYKTLAEPQDISGAKADTTYRALVYYYDSEDSYVTLYGFTLATVRAPQDADLFEEIKTDPVNLQSVWLSNNNSYINMTLSVLVGNTTSTAESTQTIDVVRSVDEEHGGITRLTLYHDQNGVSEYYSQTVYLSIPIKGFFESGEPVNLVVNTYDNGEVSNIFSIP